MLFVEKLLEKSAVRENLTRVALNRLAVPGLVFLSRPVAAVTCAGIASNTALTVNIGWGGICVTPVVHGVPMIWNQTHSPIGGEYFAEGLKSRTLKINPDFDAEMGIELFDDIIARLGYIRDIADITNPSPVNNIILEHGQLCMDKKFSFTPHTVSCQECSKKWHHRSILAR